MPQAVCEVALLALIRSVPKVRDAGLTTGHASHSWRRTKPFAPDLQPTPRLRLGRPALSRRGLARRRIHPLTSVLCLLSSVLCPSSSILARLPPSPPL